MRDNWITDGNPQAPGRYLTRKQYLDRREVRADAFDYIECLHHPRQQHRMETQRKQKSLLAQPPF
jgi:hypothetical protein